MNIEWLLKVYVPFSYGTSVHALCVFILMHNLNVSIESHFTQDFPLSAKRSFLALNIPVKVLYAK